MAAEDPWYIDCAKTLIGFFTLNDSLFFEGRWGKTIHDLPYDLSRPPESAGWFHDLKREMERNPRGFCWWYHWLCFRHWELAGTSRYTEGQRPGKIWVCQKGPIIWVRATSPNWDAPVLCRIDPREVSSPHARWRFEPWRSWIVRDRFAVMVDLAEKEVAIELFGPHECHRDISTSFVMTGRWAEFWLDFAINHERRISRR